MTGARTHRIAIGARLFTFLALAGPILWFQRTDTSVALGVVGTAWFCASLLERRPELATAVPLAEAGAVGVVAGLTIGSSEGMLLALALPPFIAAIAMGLRGCLLAVSTELTAVVLAVLVAERGTITDKQTLAIFSWTMVGLGLGLVGGYVHAALQREAAGLTPYLDAQHLIRQLLELSDDLSSGLDVTSLSGEVLSSVGDHLPTAVVGVYVPRGEVLIPLATRTLVEREKAGLDRAEALAAQCLLTGDTVVEATAFAFPLGDAAVLSGVVSPGSGLAGNDLERTITRVRHGLRTRVVQLDTALLFADFRDSASADVRKRLAREMHDGVAQDIASLGYVVDALAARPADDKQAEQFTMLRGRITAIVAEVRQSVLTLRTSIGEAASLGTAIGAVARHLSESSQIPIQVTLDEHSTRLRPEVEAELFRIAQEAMNNAIKHAQCTSIEVHCQVYAPDALITITDDGRGLQAARNDSHGLKIMRERARLVGADLSIENQADGGLLVAVQIPARS